MSDACIVNQQDGFVSLERLPHREALAILRSEGPGYSGYKSLGSICEWSEAISTVNGLLVGLLLRDPYSPIAESMLANLKGDNVTRIEDLVCILEKQGLDWEDGVGPYLPAYAVQKVDTDEVSILILEYYLDKASTVSIRRQR